MQSCDDEFYSCNQSCANKDIIAFSGVYGLSWCQLNAALYVLQYDLETDVAIANGANLRDKRI